MRVVPVGSRLGQGDGGIELLTRPHGILGDAGDTVERVGHRVAVPVDRGPGVDIVIGEPDVCFLNRV